MEWHFITFFKKLKKMRFIIFYNIIQDMNAVIIDCRSESDYKESHVLEAINIPYSINEYTLFTR